MYSFNSSVVRLRVSICSILPCYTLVSIPVWCDWETARYRGWYRCRSVSIPVWCDWEVLPGAPASLVQTVSIPVWCDWEWISRDPQDPTECVSIPVWCDWESVTRWDLTTVLRVSIPVWCDWEGRFLQWWEVQRYWFQFQCGAIERSSFSQDLTLSSKFQFQCGAIESISRCSHLCRSSVVSIPVWCDWECTLRDSYCA